jgi:predicted RecA/RadA family phage recombinase
MKWIQAGPRIFREDGQILAVAINDVAAGEIVKCHNADLAHLPKVIEDLGYVGETTVNTATHEQVFKGKDEIVADLLRDWKTGVLNAEAVCVLLFKHFPSSPAIGGSDGV